MKGIADEANSLCSDLNEREDQLLFVVWIKRRIVVDFFCFD